MIKTKAEAQSTAEATPGAEARPGTEAKEEDEEEKRRKRTMMQCKAKSMIKTQLGVMSQTPTTTRVRILRYMIYRLECMYYA